MKHVKLPAGETVPALGLGTWHLGEAPDARAAEVEAVRHALRIGYRLIDTAEMYGEGGAERIVGAALDLALASGELKREDVFVVSKFYPHHASRPGVASACAASLGRLGLETIDLYLLHWRGSHPLSETVAGLRDLQAQGRIRHWGVSNFDRDDMVELLGVEGGTACAANQVWYSAGQRGVEYDLLPWMRERSLPLMAYSPIDQSALARRPTLQRLATARGLTAAQLALAWVLRDGGVVALPKAVQPDHLRENLAAAAVELDPELRADIDRDFPPPTRPVPLAIN